MATQRDDATRARDNPVGLGATDGRKQRWAAHREARRAELVDAAVTAIERLGPSTGMDDIAAAAGVTKPVVYRYFTDKADLYVAVGQMAANQLMTTVLGAIDGGGGPRAMLTAAVDAYLRQIETTPNLYRFVVTRPAGDRGPDLAHDYQSLIAAGVARSMGRGLRDAGLDSGGAEAWAHGIVGFVRAAGDWWLERRTMGREDLTDYLVAVLWSGLESLDRQAGAAVGDGGPRLLGPGT